MAASQENWIRHRAYELWEQEGYPSGKDTEHWERAKLEYATLKPVASDDTETAPAKVKAVASKAPAAKVAKSEAKPKAAKPAGKAKPADARPKAAAATAASEQTKKPVKKASTH